MKFIIWSWLICMWAVIAIACVGVAFGFDPDTDPYLQFYAKFDDNNTDVVNATFLSGEVIEGTGSANYISSISDNFGSALNLSSNAYVNFSGASLFGGSDSRAVCSWDYFDVASSLTSNFVWEQGKPDTVWPADAGRIWGLLWGRGAEKLMIDYQSNTDAEFISFESVTNGNKWHHICVTYNNASGIMSFYLQGKLNFSVVADPGTPNTYNDRFTIGRGTLSVGNVNGVFVDELRVYGRVLNDSEISQLYQFVPEEVGEELGEFGSIDVDLVTPANGVVLRSSQVNFSWNLNVSSANCSLNLNDVRNVTLDDTSWSLLIADTSYMNWSVNCTTDSVSGISETRYFSMNTTHYTDDGGIAVTLISPANASIETSNTVSFDYSANVSSNCSLWLNGVNNVTQPSGSPFSRYVADTQSGVWQVLCSATYVQGNSDTWYLKVNTTVPTTDEAEVCPEPLSDLAMRALLTVTILLLFLLFGYSYLKGRR